MPRRRPEQKPPVAVFRGGPRHQQTMPKTTAGRWPTYRDPTGESLRVDRGDHRFRVVGELYVLMLEAPGDRYPAGSRVYKWQPARQPGAAS